MQPVPRQAAPWCGCNNRQSKDLTVTPEDAPDAAIELKRFVCAIQVVALHSAGRHHRDSPKSPHSARTDQCHYCAPEKPGEEASVLQRPCPPDFGSSFVVMLCGLCSSVRQMRQCRGSQCVID